MVVKAEGVPTYQLGEPDRHCEDTPLDKRKYDRRSFRAKSWRSERLARLDGGAISLEPVVPGSGPGPFSDPYLESGAKLLRSTQ